MGIDARKRGRPSRNQSLGSRRLRLGYYYVVTDATRTEPNYLKGFKESLPADAKENIEIHVETVPTAELLDRCIDACALQPQHRIPWIVFDRDRVVDFDQIISDAEKHGARVAWSNPCIEVWLGAYFGQMINKTESQHCVSEFGRLFRNKLGQEYDKSDARIYEKLKRIGDESGAIKLVANRHALAQTDCKAASEMCPCSTMYQLISEIRDKVSD